MQPSTAEQLRGLNPVSYTHLASVKTVAANAGVQITGQGSIGTAGINVDGVTIEQKPDEIDWGKGCLLYTSAVRTRYFVRNWLISGEI